MKKNPSLLELMFTRNAADACPLCGSTKVVVNTAPINGIIWSYCNDQDRANRLTCAFKWSKSWLEYMAGKHDAGMDVSQFTFNPPEGWTSAL